MVLTISFLCFHSYLLIAIAILLCFYFVYCSNYIRMCFYVSKIPGPPAYPIIGNAALLIKTNGDLIRIGIDIMNKYHKLARFWLGPVPVIITTEPKIIQELLTSHKYLGKARLVKIGLKYLVGDSILLSEASKWKENRSIVVKGFSPIILKSYFKIFVEKIDILTQKLDLELNNEKSFDIFEYLSRATLDSICGSTMGVNVHAQESNSSYCNAMEMSLQIVMKRVLNPLYHPEIIYQMTKDYVHLSRYSNIVWGLTKKVLNEKKTNTIQAMNENRINNNLKSFYVNKKNEDKKPLLDYLLDFSKSHPSFIDRQLEEEVNLVIFAAYETSANALSYLLLNLAMNKTIQTKVYDEISKVLSDENREKVDYDDLSKFKYMDMALKESMRLFSTIPLIGREVSEDIKIENYLIPKGVEILIPIFCLHRDEELWKNPLEFNPERFAPENIKNHHPYAYIPFSAGPRNCIGMRYAWIFMKTALATLLSRYEFHTDLKLDELKFEPILSLKLIGGHQVQITPRHR